MRKRAFTAWVVALIGVCGWTELIACGDKFLLPTRGSRFEQAPAPRAPADILVYANPASELSRTLTNLSVASALRKAGYRPTVVASADEFLSALRQSRWDLVLVDLADVQTVSGSRTDASAPVVVPVAYRTTSSELAQAKSQYSSILRNPTKTKTFLDVIDAVLDARREAQAKTSSKHP